LLLFQFLLLSLESLGDLVLLLLEESDSTLAIILNLHETLDFLLLEVLLVGLVFLGQLLCNLGFGLSNQFLSVFGIIL